MTTYGRIVVPKNSRKKMRPIIKIGIKCANRQLFSLRTKKTLKMAAKEARKTSLARNFSTMAEGPRRCDLPRILYCVRLPRAQEKNL